MWLAFKTGIANAAKLYMMGMGHDNVEIRGIRFAEDAEQHRRLGYSVVTWRIIGFGFGIQHQSAEMIALGLFNKMPEVNYHMTKTGLAYIPDSLAFVPEPIPPTCRDCSANTERDFTGLASPLKCHYDVGGKTMLASAWPSAVTTDGCKNLESFTHSIVEV